MLHIIKYFKNHQRVEIERLNDQGVTTATSAYHNAYVIYEDQIVTVYQGGSESKPSSRILVTSLTNTLILFK